MPVVWESPVPIDNALAEGLATYVVNKAGDYADRTIAKPVQEFTEEDADNDTVAVWWILLKRDWEDFKIRSAQPTTRIDEKGRRFEQIPMWAPSLFNFGEAIAKRLERYQREEYDPSEVLAAKAELQSLVGFSAYAYHKHELR